MDHCSRWDRRRPDRAPPPLQHKDDTKGRGEARVETHRVAVRGSSDREYSSVLIPPCLLPLSASRWSRCLCARCRATDRGRGAVWQRPTGPWLMRRASDESHSSGQRIRASAEGWTQWSEVMAERAKRVESSRGPSGRGALRTGPLGPDSVSHWRQSNED